MPQFIIHSRVEGRLDGFYVLLMNKAALSVCAGFHVDMTFQLLWMNPEACDHVLSNSMFSLKRNCPAAFQGACTDRELLLLQVLTSIR